MANVRAEGRVGVVALVGIGLALGIGLGVGACSSEETGGAGGQGGFDCGCAGEAGTVPTGGSGAAAGHGPGGHGGTGGSGAAGGAGGASFQPAPGTSWQWQLTGLPIDTSFDVAVYDVDLFETSDADLTTLHADGRKIICYFSAGSFEDYRPDAADFPANVKGNPLDPPWQDELWLDVTSPVVRQIMQARLDLAVTRGCDAVEPDNVDGYAADNGFGFTAADQLDYNQFIASEAHARHLSVGLKNDVEQLSDLAAYFDWALNEECYDHTECGAYSTPFIDAGKAVFQAEYVDGSELAAVCAVTQPLQLSTIVKNLELDAYRLACP